MTSLDELITGQPPTKQPGQWRRQGDNGPPIVTAPNGDTVKTGARAGEPKLLTYSRPSNFGKQIENTYNLQKWSERMVALGMTALGPNDLDKLSIGPYDTQEWRELADGYVVEAKRAAGATVKAEQGTHGHLITEDSDLERSVVGRIEAGEDIGLDVNIQLAIGATWRRLSEHFEVLATEAACVYDRWRVAGTLDRIVRLKHDMHFDGRTIPAGDVIVLDIKTGNPKLDNQNYPMYWLSYAVQIAAYAHSVPYDVDLEQRGEWPWQINKWQAVIAHIDIGGALDTDVLTAQLFYVDLAAGYEAGELVCQAKEWQRRRDVFSTPAYILAETVSSPVVPASTVETDATGGVVLPAASPVANIVNRGSAMSPDSEATGELAHTSPVANPETRAMIVQRVRALVDAGHAERLTRAWPQGIPGMRDPYHTPAELSAVLAAVRTVEDETSAPFHPADAAPPPEPSPKVPVVKAPPPIDEGPPADPDAIAALKQRFERLPQDMRNRIGAVTADAANQGRSISVVANPSTRRYHIARALVAFGEAGWNANDVDDIVAAVGADCDVPEYTIDQARRLADMAEHLTEPF